ncbi:hypothetical protein HA402_014773 [Bradysia odoriphaga]|nr:hypothetical protein HA402_014773 [Bradysia odoriphaga]
MQRSIFFFDRIESQLQTTKTIVNISVVRADICDLCSCDGEESETVFRIKCLTETKVGTVNVDLENIQWPTINRSLEAHFNNMQFDHLPKLLGSATVKAINLDHNLIETIKSDPFKQCKNLKSLSIANNSIHDLPKDFLKSTHLLRHLNLSHNSLSDIDSGVLSHLTSLRSIDLSYNKLKTLSVGIVDTLDNVEILNLEGNDIIFIQIPERRTLPLEILDLSFNAFTTVPQNLGAKAPRLDTLILDHNPIEIIDFVDPIYLRKLSLKNMSLLQDISAAALRNVDGQDDCMEVVISHCEKLSNIDRNAMRHLDLCYLDLSYNNLSSIPELLTNWTRLNKGIDLQGNPFECSCSEQWMLDVILQQLYLNESQQQFAVQFKVHRT